LSRAGHQADHLEEQAPVRGSRWGSAALQARVRSLCQRLTLLVHCHGKNLGAIPAVTVHG